MRDWQYRKQVWARLKGFGLSRECDHHDVNNFPLITIKNSPDLNVSSAYICLKQDISMV